MGMYTFLKVVLRNWWLIGLATLVTAGSTAFFVLRKPPVYRAATVIEMKPSSALTNPNQIGEAFDVLNRRGTLNTIARKAAMSSMNPLISQKLRIPVDEVRRAAIAAIVLPDSNLIEIRAQSTNPELAAAIANTAADIVMSQNPEKLLTMEIVEFAAPPSASIDPDPKQLIGLGVLFGAVLGVIFALLGHAVQVVLAVERQRLPVVPAIPLQVPRPDESHARALDGETPHIDGAGPAVMVEPDGGPIPVLSSDAVGDNRAAGLVAEMAPPSAEPAADPPGVESWPADSGADARPEQEIAIGAANAPTIDLIGSSELQATHLDPPQRNGKPGKRG
jgi:capsular polysaccharide biosynthesis protein